MKRFGWAVIGAGAFVVGWWTCFLMGVYAGKGLDSIRLTVDDDHHDVVPTDEDKAQSGVIPRDRWDGLPVLERPDIRPTSWGRKASCPSCTYYQCAGMWSGGAGGLHLCKRGDRSVQVYWAAW